MKLNQRLLAHPILLCSFRPFFVFTVISAVLFMALWLASLQGWLPALAVPGGWTLWHGHELLLGFAAAATAGFALTAIPEFTKTDFMAARPLLSMSLLWLAARLAYLLSGLLGVWPALLLNLAFWLFLLWRILPPTWQDPGRTHISFPLAVVVMASIQVGFFISLAQPGQPLAWLYLAAHLFMVLIILAASRVSMSVVNNLVEGERSLSDPDAALYLARPPRRNLAMASILLCAFTEFWLGSSPVTGWTALAAMAAILHLLNDWHIGRPLVTNRLALMLYGGYWLMALGYGALGAAYMGAPMLPSAARHLLLAGSIGLVIFTIMCIVSRIHSGLWLDRRRWISLAAIVLIAAALIRASAGVHGFMSHYNLLLIGAGLLWMAAYLLFARHFFGILLSPRSDGKPGCAEP
jgi:uncharacterized protein involved in response to NO